MNEQLLIKNIAEIGKLLLKNGAEIYRVIIWNSHVSPFMNVCVKAMAFKI